MLIIACVEEMKAMSRQRRGREFMSIQYLLPQLLVIIYLVLLFSRGHVEDQFNPRMSGRDCIESGESFVKK